MILRFKQKFFSFFASYDVYDENGSPYFYVKGKSVLQKFFVYDKNSNHVGVIKKKIFSFLPKYEVINGNTKGTISKRFSFLKDKFDLDYNGWYVEGDWIDRNYKILSREGNLVATVSKEFFKLTDTFTIDIVNDKDALDALMIVVVIDAQYEHND